MVGHELLRVLAQRDFPSKRVSALASERSKGLTVPYNGGSITVEPLDEKAFKGVDVALFVASGDIALMYGPLAAEAGALVIDNSSAWRMKANVPLVVPEVNGADIRDNEGIIANPNCCAIPLAMILNPLKDAAGLERVLVSTYQSASGAGRALVDELEEQTRAIAYGTPPQVSAYPYQLAYNVVPGGWRPEAEGYNEEEVKIVNETRKILHMPELRITATCVRVPVPVGHGESVFVETRDKISADEARTLFATAPGVMVEDDPHAKLYPTPHQVAGKDEVYVGRIRNDPSVANGLALWLVSDNLRKGAALNAVQIAEQAIEMGVLAP
jgi:aspartate-semialdehyde dehydrogenase